MTLSQMVIAGSALVIVLLSVVVARLASQLTQLSRQVDHLQGAPEPPAPLPSPAPSGEFGSTSEERALEPSVERPSYDQGDEDVSVITHVDDQPDDDLTTARIASVTLGGPLIKVAALSHGVRRALREEHRMRIAYVVRKEMRRQRNIRRRRRAERAPSQGWTP